MVNLAHTNKHGEACDWHPETVRLNPCDFPEGVWTKELESQIRQDLYYVFDGGLEFAEDLIFHDFNVSSGIDKPSILVDGGTDGFDVTWIEERDDDKID